jgi:hypothetical protein
VSFSERIRNNSVEDREGKEPDTDSRSSRLISAYLADDSVRQLMQAGNEIRRKISIEKKVMKLPDKESVTKISKSITEEKVRNSPPEAEPQKHQKKQRRFSLEEKLASKEKKKNSNENPHRYWDNLYRVQWRTQKLLGRFLSGTVADPESVHTL